MSFVSDKYYNDKLHKYNINIKTKYIVGNKILERNTNNNNNDDIKNGIRCEKDYYINNKLEHTEKTFDSRIEYTFISKEQDEQDHKCINCGMSSKLKDFIDGCPYCGTYYNIDYKDKNLGSKYHYDLVLKNTTYRIVTAIIDIIISLFLSYLFIKTTSRTFNTYDISKIFIYGIILSLILYYFFYIIDGYVILEPIRRYKEKQNKKQIDFWNRTGIDKTIFFNNLNYEIRKKYYNIDNVIDYDIIDFINFQEFNKNNNLYVKVEADIRIVYYINHKITSENIKDTYIVKRINEDTLKLKEGSNLIKCPNCGASIDITKKQCEHCNTEIKYFQEWIIEE